MRKLILIAALLTTSAAHAARVTFVQPLDGSQTVGPQLVEITTDAKNVDRVEFSIDGVLAGVARRAPWRIAHDFGTSLAAHEITAKVFSAGYTSIDTATVRTAALSAGESITVDLVEVPMRVRSAKTLRPSDITVKENGVRQTVREVRPERGNAHFAFVIDRSLSMGDGRLEAALAAVDDARRLLRPGDTVSIVLFNHNVATARRLDTRDRVRDLLAKITPSGGTSLRDAVASIASSDRTYAIVITDGGDRNSALSAEPALRKISGTRTVVDAIVLGRSSDFLDRAARNTGGTVVKTERSGIGAALQDLIADINSRYLLVYQSQGTKRGWRSIDVKPNQRSIQVVNARKGYFAP